MIDIHSHILHGFDDGAGSFEESLAMVRMAAEAGTTDIVASPHANLEFEFHPEQVRERIAELQQAAGSAPRIHYGCDFHLSFDNIQDALAHPARYSINGKGYLLVEFSDLAIFNTTTGIFDQLLQAGLVPIITHPERNQLLVRRLRELEGWVAMGCMVQVTAQSYMGRFGRRARQFSETLMKKGMVHCVASDAHDTRHRPPVLEEAWDHLKSRYGEEAARRLLLDNPKSVIEGLPIARETLIPMVPVRRWGWW